MMDKKEVDVGPDPDLRRTSKRELRMVSLLENQNAILQAHSERTAELLEEQNAILQVQAELTEDLLKSYEKELWRQERQRRRDAR